MVKMNIALDDIRSKAPEGATHYDDNENYYIGIKNGVITQWYQWIDEEWQTPWSMFINPKPLN